ncbi:MAG: hypothetical protein JSW73_00085 [Candidatus Woesearchaeota archaeon]|nr:MAG: hypothetical protein JSW73_00085 [Candidatus Woesearchaeota archaeon]
MAKAKLKRKKKKWFEVKANIGPKPVVLGEVLGYEIKDILGRRIISSYDHISNNPKDQKTKVEFMIVETKGTDGIAEPHAIYYQDSFIGQKIKRDKSRSILVIREKSKDNKEIKLKFVFSAKSKFNRSINSALLKHLENHFKEFIKSTNSKNLFNIELTKKETAVIKEKARKIYPIDKLYIWKLSII